MTEMMQGLLAEAKNGRYSSIKDTISEDDISSVWENVGSYIEKQMSQQKGVNIPNLGVFSFSQNKLDIGNSKIMLIQRPVFNVSEKFAQTHGLHFTKYLVPGTIPVVPLNYAALSFESPFDRDTVESCFRETLNAVNRALSNKKNVEILFAGIGRLSIRDSRVKMKFFKDFVNQMDGSGKLVDSLQNRPGTMDSVMSERSLLSRSATNSTLVLPKISSSQPLNGNLPPLLEQQEEPEFMAPSAEYLAPALENQIPDLPTDMPVGMQPLIGDEYDTVPPVNDDDHSVPEPITTDFNTDHAIDNILNTGEIAPPNYSYTGEDEQAAPLLINEDDNQAIITEPYLSRSGSRLAMALPKANGIGYFDDMVPSTLTPKLSQFSPMAPPTPLVSKSCPGPNFLSEGDGLFSSIPSLHKIPSPPHLAPLGRVRSAEPVTEFKEVSFAENTKPSSACGHSNAGQEICYLCHQRSNRNIPVSFNEERNRREEEENLLLQEFQSLRDGEDMLREQEKLLAKRNDLQKIAAFNLGVADAVNSGKKQRNTEFHRSYVFQRRPLTPPRFPKQDAYSRDLQKQVSNKEKIRSTNKADTDILERLEQVQLAEDLAAQREQYLKDKYERQESYKTSLETQVRVRDQFRKPDGLFKTPDLLLKDQTYFPEEPVSFLTVPRPNFLRPFNEGQNPRSPCSLERLRFKPTPIKSAEADSEVFGLNDVNNEKMAERRKRAYDLFREQQDFVAQKKRDAILRRLAEQEEEEQVLQKTKQEMIEDRSNRFSRRFQHRKNLEEDWFGAAQAKRARDLQERLSNLHTGMLVHEQCDKYKRCKKCQRKTTNCGESNIWSESRYIPGSRLMV